MLSPAASRMAVVREDPEDESKDAHIRQTGALTMAGARAGHLVDSHCFEPFDPYETPRSIVAGKTNLSRDGLNPAHVPCWWVNNPTLGEFCFAMIGRADIEGSKSDVAMNAWPPQASYPCGNFSDTSC
ncbi:hypothetical protein ANTRET_LOCUS11022 [Anthophora retusa]